MENIIVNFIPEDFEGNEYSDSKTCPAARAVSRELKTQAEAGVISVFIEKKPVYKIKNVKLNENQTYPEIDGFSILDYLKINDSILTGNFKSASLELESIED